jgi:Cu(I)/Ag(I) efflux system membrane protein CusA/SilA
MLGRLIEWSGRNPFLVSVLAAFGLTWGIVALRSSPLDAVPDLSDAQVIVYTEWTGRSPTLVEDQITYPISTLFLSAPKVKFVRGESIFGKSFVYVIFEDGTDIYWARSRVLEYLNSVRGRLPEGVSPTLGPDATGVGWVYEYALVDESGSHDLAELRSFQDWTLRYALASVHGVSEVASVGGYVRQYQVNLDPDKLVAYGVRFSEVVDAVRKGNRDVGGKSFEVSTMEYYIRGRGYFQSLADVGNAVVRTDPQGFPILVRQLGSLTLGGDLRQGLVEFGGKGETVGGIVVMRYGENALRVIDGIKKKLKTLEGSFPSGVRLVPTYDRSELIHRSIRTLWEKLIEESLVVSLVCIVFLWHVRSALVAILLLPAAIVLSFIPFSGLRLTANIMSLGGIAIAIGAMVDGAVIMVENAHKQLEEARERSGKEPRGEERLRVLLSAAKMVGRPLFFSLLVITVSFVPVFALEAQEGRLFRPLAFTKTFAMFFAALLSVTLVPVLMLWFIRGRIVPEKRNPLNRLLLAAYDPVLRFVLRYRIPVLLLALAVLASTLYPISRLGAEFMPPLNEGTLLYMPTAVPGVAIAEAARILQTQDRIIARMPEVATVFGKVGQADTATDPAPLSMTETVVTFRPESQWRKGMTWDKLVAELNRQLQFPGVANIFWMPIQTRTEMLTTGFRSNLGIKIFGSDLNVIRDLGEKIERTLSGFPDTRSVFAERVEGGRYLDIQVRREALARYGFTVEDVNQAIEGAIGGNTVTVTVEGRERYPVSVRYNRDFRQDPLALSRILLGESPAAVSLAASPQGSPPGPIAGVQVPLGELADIHFTFGPPEVRSENAQLVGFVFVDSTAKDLVGYVQKAGAEIARNVAFPPGYYVEWAGSYEYFLRAKQRLFLLIPLTLVIIFVLLHLNTRSMGRTFLVLLAVPFSLVGAFWLLYWLGYNLSVAVAVGLIALAGLDAETGVIMLLYLDHAYDERSREGRMRSRADLRAAIEEGALGRIRPKMMTICAILFGLLPILWSQETGADVMKRIAAPMVGGIVTSGVLELLLYPILYFLWRGRGLPRGGEPSEARPELGSAAQQARS